MHVPSPPLWYFKAPPDPGPCHQSLFRYYYDPATDECKRFNYGGCGGTLNRFLRRQQCRQKCAKNYGRPAHEAPIFTQKRNPVLEKIFKTSKLEDQSTARNTASPGLHTQRSNFAEKTPAKPSGNCPVCDPLYGRCVDGKCACVKGFRLEGRICVDVDECRIPGSCPPSAICTNSFGSFRCECAGGKCDQSAEVCEELFERKLEDVCDENIRETRYYFEKATSTCHQFTYRGCETTARNVFPDQHICEKVCAAKVKQRNEQLDGVLEQISIDDNKNNNAKSTKKTEETAFEKFSTSATTPDPVYSVPESTPEISAETENPLPGKVDPCLQPFDEVLRLECIEATWIEKFYWVPERKECEAFWYDGSCDPEDAEGKNIFETESHCLHECNTTKQMAITTAPVAIEIDNAEEIAKSTPKAAQAVNKQELPQPIPSQIPPGKPTFKLETTAHPQQKNAEFTVPADIWKWQWGKETGDSWITRRPQNPKFDEPKLQTTDAPQLAPTLVTWPPKIPEPQPQRKMEIPDVEVTTENVKAADPCLEHLDPKLEEDCNGDKWEIKWYFNPAKKACRRFWWGGCEGDSLNFFADSESCKARCANRFVEEGVNEHFPISEAEVIRPKILPTEHSQQNEIHDPGFANRVEKFEQTTQGREEYHETTTYPDFQIKHVLPTDPPIILNADFE
ncbi:unnamed protein product, partial [Mesorhabditis spiculigera]